MAFPKKTPDEVKLLTFDFTKEAAEGSILSTPILTVESVVSGTGGAIGDVTLSTGVLSGKVVSCLATGGKNGVVYRLRCDVDADNGEHHEIEKDLPVSDVAALVK